MIPIKAAQSKDKLHVLLVNEAGLDQGMSQVNALQIRSKHSLAGSSKYNATVILMSATSKHMQTLIRFSLSQPMQDGTCN